MRCARHNYFLLLSNHNLYTKFYFRADIGVIGLAVMGQNLILNMNDHGFVVCAFNRSPEKVTDFLENGAKGTQVCYFQSIEISLLLLTFR